MACCLYLIGKHLKDYFVSVYARFRTFVVLLVKLDFSVAFTSFSNLSEGILSFILGKKCAS